MKKRIFSLFTISLLLISVFAGCSKGSGDKDILFPIEGNVRTIDPQSASASDEMLIVENSMEGLVRLNEKGEIVPGVAKEWSISDDKLTYSFKLRDNSKWDLNENIKKMMGKNFNPPITANDFVFAFKRACSNVTQAPYFNSISAVENAVAVHSGQADESTLGVMALGDYELEIRLSSPDENFLETLTTPIAMPCNEEFFNATKGRYGLEKDYTLFNGPFYLSKWLENSFILRRSAPDVYKGTSPAVPSKLTLNIPQDPATVLPNLEKGVYDAAIISGPQSDKLDKKAGVELIPYENTVWSYIFNCADNTFSNENIRRAFCHAFEEVQDIQSSYYGKAQGIVPAACNINNKAYRDYVGESGLYQNDENAALKYWKAGLNELSPAEMPITVLCTPEMEQYAKQSVQGIQKSIARQLTYTRSNGVSASVELSIKISVVTEEEMKDAIRTDTFQLALYPVRAQDDNALQFFTQFAGESNPANLNMPEYDSLIAQGASLRSGEEIANVLGQCEKMLIKSCSVMPLMTESAYFATAKGVYDVRFTTHTGRVNFVYTRRSD